MQETANKRKLSKLVGWGAAFFTGGLGPTDLILVPGINKLLLKWFNIDLDFISGKLSLAVRQRQVCLYQRINLQRFLFFRRADLFSYSYSLEEKKVRNGYDKVYMFIELANPLANEEQLRFTMSEVELYEKLTDQIEKGAYAPGVRTLNKCLKKYLESSKKTKNMLYQTLSTNE